MDFIKFKVLRFDEKIDVKDGKVIGDNKKGKYVL